MFELIPSEWMRNYLKDKREFNDWEKAALIWNSPVHIWRERLDSLKELSAITDDEKLNTIAASYKISLYDTLEEKEYKGCKSL